MQGIIVIFTFIRYTAIITVVSLVLFSGDPSLLDAVKTWLLK